MSPPDPRYRFQAISPLCVMCHMPRVTQLISYVTFHISHVRCHFSWQNIQSIAPMGPMALWPYGPMAQWADAFYESIYPSVCPSVCPSVRLSVRLSVCVFTFEVPFKLLFAPTSCCLMSIIFRDSESLGESNEKKWSQI